MKVYVVMVETFERKVIPLGVYSTFHKAVVEGSVLFCRRSDCENYWIEEVDYE